VGAQAGVVSTCLNSMFSPETFHSVMEIELWEVWGGRRSRMQNGFRRNLVSIALSVLIPAVDEADNLCELLPALHRVLSSIVESYEIIVVDGGLREQR
jgi:hypothetical protein